MLAVTILVHCVAIVSPVESFLSRDVRGKHVWLQPSPGRITLVVSLAELITPALH